MSTATMETYRQFVAALGYDASGVKYVSVDEDGAILLQYYIDPGDPEKGFLEADLQLKEPEPAPLRVGDELTSVEQMHALPVGARITNFASEDGWTKLPDGTWRDRTSNLSAEVVRFDWRKVEYLPPVVGVTRVHTEAEYAALPVGTTLWPSYVKQSDAEASDWWYEKTGPNTWIDGSWEGARAVSDADFSGSDRYEGRLVRSLPAPASEFKVGDKLHTAADAEALPVGSSVWWDGNTGPSLYAGWWVKTAPNHWVSYDYWGMRSEIHVTYTDAGLIEARTNKEPRCIRSVGGEK